MVQWFRRFGGFQRKCFRGPSPSLSQGPEVSNLEPKILGSGVIASSRSRLRQGGERSSLAHDCDQSSKRSSKVGLPGGVGALSVGEGDQIIRVDLECSQEVLLWGERLDRSGACGFKVGGLTGVGWRLGVAGRSVMTWAWTWTWTSWTQPGGVNGF